MPSVCLSSLCILWRGLLGHLLWKSETISPRRSGIDALSMPPFYLKGKQEMISWRGEFDRTCKLLQRESMCVWEKAATPVLVLHEVSGNSEHVWRQHEGAAPPQGRQTESMTGLTKRCFLQPQAPWRVDTPMTHPAAPLYPPPAAIACLVQADMRIRPAEQAHEVSFWGWSQAAGHAHELGEAWVESRKPWLCLPCPDPACSSCLVWT